jgi:hypothetical protein
MPTPGGNRYGKADEQSMVITPPREDTIIVRDIILTLDIIRVPASWLNKYVNLIALGNDAYFLTGPDISFNALTLTQSAVDPSTKVVTLGGKPFPMPQAAIVPYYFDADADAFMGVFNPVGAGGKWFGAPSSPNSGMT